MFEDVEYGRRLRTKRACVLRIADADSAERGLLNRTAT